MNNAEILRSLLDYTPVGESVHSALLAGAEALEALKTIRDEVLNTDANMLNNDQINYVLGIIDNYMSLPEPPKEG